jgi:hypothetical protein
VCVPVGSHSHEYIESASLRRTCVLRPGQPDARLVSVALIAWHLSITYMLSPRDQIKDDVIFLV